MQADLMQKRFNMARLSSQLLWIADNLLADLWLLWCNNPAKTKC